LFFLLLIRPIKKIIIIQSTPYPVNEQQRNIPSKQSKYPAYPPINMIQQPSLTAFNLDIITNIPPMENLRLSMYRRQTLPPLHTRIHPNTRLLSGHRSFLFIISIGGGGGGRLQVRGDITRLKTRTSPLDLAAWICGCEEVGECEE